MAGLAILTALVAGAVAFMQVAVPLAPPSFALAEATHYWQVAMIAGLVVLIAGGVTAWLALATARRSE